MGHSNYKAPGMTTIAFNNNPTLNRYEYVTCQDQFRVILDGDPKRNYIHANYVETPLCNKRFIACQAPIIQTIGSFWQMIIQEEVEIIVMACQTIERGSGKCAEYWQQVKGETSDFEGIAITNEGSSPLFPADTSIIKTNLSLKQMTAEGVQKVRNITHIQFLNWEDNGCPQELSHCLNVLEVVRKSTKPIVVHCSAGIGRTGTLVGIGFVLDQLEAQYEARTEPLIVSLRRYRASAVQNHQQYLFIYRSLLHNIVVKGKEDYKGILDEEMHQLNTNFEDDFKQFANR